MRSCIVMLYTLVMTSVFRVLSDIYVYVEATSHDQSMASNSWCHSSCRNSGKEVGIGMAANEGDSHAKVYNPWTSRPGGFSMWYPNPAKSVVKSDDESEKDTKVKVKVEPMSCDQYNDESEESVVVQYIKLSRDAKVPKRMSPGAAGYDLYSVGDHCIAPMSKEEVSIGLQIRVPANTYGRIAPRSGLASQHFIHVGAGVIDRDYRGCVTVLLFNFGASPFFVFKGDRIAQLIIERTAQPVFVEADGSLDATARGFAGRGSTGRR